MRLWEKLGVFQDARGQWVPDIDYSPIGEEANFIVDSRTVGTTTYYNIKAIRKLGNDTFTVTQAGEKFQTVIDRQLGD